MACYTAEAQKEKERTGEAGIYEEDEISSTPDFPVTLDLCSRNIRENTNNDSSLTILGDK